jgi:hypothetical protein
MMGFSNLKLIEDYRWKKFDAHYWITFENRRFSLCEWLL